MGPPTISAEQPAPPVNGKRPVLRRFNGAADDLGGATIIEHLEISR
ncbi:hypothetical protein TC41_0035 [Alicyclobacillus acidocaldarius subsp. acidocaldarius Tc-4-1]|uniref:Uncharacterized protein n=1 Tax=Alicyclobacillus acidocaldarius (strain Tc-4-1) TaxID=1048834 RepID=F8IHP8_ALIAT|nr:hypothetical protein TC41_0035 [Alicyclobacillus acidocaldarius subsp. acidocaldarius Tc-4-1]